MPDFSRRSDRLELIDAPDVPIALWRRNLREIAFINRWLGGDALSLRGLTQLIDPPGAAPLHVVDLGCGSGDTLVGWARWARRHAVPLRFTGVDLSATAIEVLRERCRDYPEISSEVADYRDYLRQIGAVDIAHCSLFCHHLPDPALRELFATLRARTRRGFVVNDLHRHPLAYYSIRTLTRLFGGTPLVRHDAPLSVLRAFRREELRQLLAEAGAGAAALSWAWAFRWLIVFRQADRQ